MHIPDVNQLVKPGDCFLITSSENSEMSVSLHHYPVMFSHCGWLNENLIYISFLDLHNFLINGRN